jgi:hypothetical protein
VATKTDTKKDETKKDETKDAGPVAIADLPELFADNSSIGDKDEIARVLDLYSHEAETWFGASFELEGATARACAFEDELTLLVLLPDGTPDLAHNTAAWSAVFESRVEPLYTDAVRAAWERKTGQVLSGKETGARVDKFRRALRQYRSDNKRTLLNAAKNAVTMSEDLAKTKVQVGTRPVKKRDKTVEMVPVMETVQAILDKADRGEMDGREIPQVVRDAVKVQYSEQKDKNGKVLKNFQEVPTHFGPARRAPKADLVHGTADPSTAWVKVRKDLAVKDGKMTIPPTAAVNEIHRAISDLVLAFVGPIGEKSDASNTITDFGGKKDETLKVLSTIADLAAYGVALAKGDDGNVSKDELKPLLWTADETSKK